MPRRGVRLRYVVRAVTVSQYRKAAADSDRFPEHGLQSGPKPWPLLLTSSKRLNQFASFWKTSTPF